VKPAPIPIDAKLVEKERRAICDEWGELDRQVQAFAPIKSRHEKLAQLIRSWYDQHPSEVEALAKGNTYDVQVGARGRERHFSVKAKATIFRELGKAAAMQAFSITLKAAEALLGEERVNELVTWDNTGSRKLVAVLRAPAKDATKDAKAA
jgi:hypothetical protein